MTLPLQQGCDPTAARHVPLPPYVATAELELLNDFFYAAEVKVSHQSVGLMPPITSRVRGFAAKDYGGNRWLSSYSAGCRSATSDGKRVMTRYHGAQFFWQMCLIIGFLAGHLLVFWPPMHAANRLAVASHSHMLDMRKLTWLGPPDIELNFHKANTVLNALESELVQLAAFWRPYQGLGTLRLV